VTPGPPEGDGLNNDASKEGADPLVSSDAVFRPSRTGLPFVPSILPLTVLAPKSAVKVAVPVSSTV
jgi:hypothetical protein